MQNIPLRTSFRKNCMFPIHQAPNVDLPEDSPSSAIQFEASIKMTPPNSLGTSNVFQRIIENESLSESPYRYQEERAGGNKKEEDSEKSKNRRIELFNKKNESFGRHKKDANGEGNH